MILDIAVCDNAATAETILIIKNILTIIRYVVPVILIVMSMFQIVKNVTSDSVDNEKMMSSLSKKIIAAVIVFLVPTIVSIAMSIAEGINLTQNDCWTKASKEYVQQLKNEENDKVTKEQDAKAKTLKEKFIEMINAARQIIIKQYTKEDKTDNSSDSNTTSFDPNASFGDWDLFYQYDNRWGTESTCNAGTLVDSGCGYTSFAMIANHFSSSTIAPPDATHVICSKTGENGNAMDDETFLNNSLLNHYGLNAQVLFYRGGSEKVSTKKSLVEEALRNGKPVILLIPGHYIVLAKIDGNQVLVLNPGLDGTNGEAGKDGRTGWYSSIDSVYKYTNNYKNRCSSQSICGWIYAIAYSKS